MDGKEVWYIETSLTGREQDWRTDTSGMVGYDDRQGALGWAQKLATIHPHVRLRHQVTTFEVLS